MADYGKGGKGGRRGGGKGGKGGKMDMQEDYGYGGDAGKGYGGGKSSPTAGGKSSISSKDVVHHYPPKEMAADVGYPIRGGQTLLIAYFPWEASESDIEREFSKFCRVKRVHLVVDKSSRKPRCFGFVKFLSKNDAEEALQATVQGLVQLPDTRGHVWHLKAEWTKSGDMVVDDSEAEQEVAKRKEERRSRCDLPGALTPARGGCGKGASPPPKGALHPGVPAPLPPLQTRYPQAALGMPPPPPSGMHQPGMGVPPLQQPLPPQGQLYGGQPMYGSQSQLYGNQAYGGALSGASPVGPALGRDSSGVSSGLDAPGLPGSAGAYPPPASSAPPPLLRDLQGYASAYPGSGYAAAVAAAAAQQASGYPPAQAQNYVGAQGYGAGQSPYVSSQQAYASSAQAYSGQQAAYAAGLGQQAYQTAAATASGAGQPPGYGSQLQGYPPQGAAAYGAPPGYGAYAQQASSYPANPATAYATSNFGLNQQSAYQYPHQPAGVMAYGSYPGAQPGQATLPQQQPQHAMPSNDLSRPQEATVGVAQMPPHQVPIQQTQQAYAQSQPMPSPEQAVASGTLAGQGVTAPGGDQSQHQYLDMVWQLSDMSLNEKAPLPAPPAQQPPAPPAGHVAGGLAVPAGVSEKWEGAGRPGAGAGPAAAVWNSFDDAAAKGMVDGLVGGDDGTAAPPPLPPPPPGAGGSNAVWGSH